MLMKVVMLAVFFGITIGIGLYSRKHATDLAGFVLGGRGVGPWLTAFAYGTSYFSAVIFVGYAGQFGWKFGIASTWIGIGNAMIGSLLAWVFLGRRTRIMTKKLSSSTMPDFFEKRYFSRGLKTGASVIIFVFLIPYTASLYNGLSRLFSMAFSVDYTVCIIAMAVLTGIYVIAGGYMATAINDFFQGMVMLVGIVCCIAAVLAKNGGFYSSLAELAKVNDPSVSDIPGVFASFFGPDPLSLLSVVVLTSLGTWGLPQMVQKFYAIKSEHDINKGTVISTLFAVVISGGCYFLGGFGRIFATGEEVAAHGFDFIVPNMISTLPDILIAVVVVLVLSASMSTLSSLVLTSSSTITMDFLNGFVFKKIDEKKQLLLVRIFVVVFIAVSSVIAIVQYKSRLSFIAQFMGISWGAMAGAFLAPFLYGLYSKNISAASVWTSFVFGVGIMCVNMFAKSTLPTFLQSPINCGAFAMVGGLVIVPIVSLFTKKPDKEKVEKIFECYTKTVTAPAIDFLEDTEE